ncbi:Uncharacterised protein [uncultured archaeon]|nr:Uncharacterised protein [uncultured archaeon]
MKIYHTYSLGNVATFDRLATLARRSKHEWKKVARLVQRFNILFSSNIHNYPSTITNCIALSYIVRSVRDTNISSDIKQEIYKIYGLTNYKVRHNLLRISLFDWDTIQNTTHNIVKSTQLDVIDYSYLSYCQTLSIFVQPIKLLKNFIM